MSGLSIDHGGVIAVDTDQIRDVASRVRGLFPSFQEVEDAIARAQVFLTSPWSDLYSLRWSLSDAANQLGWLITAVTDTAAAVLLMAEAYEVVELRARADALARTDAAAAAAIDARLQRLLAEDDRLGPLADALEQQAEGSRYDGLGGGFFPGGMLSVAFVGTTSALGRVRPGATLDGAADPVRISEVARSHPAGAPSGLTGALRRMPAASGAQVAVEKYTMPGGQPRYLAYLRGSLSMAPNEAGGREPWDMKSNAELYTGRRSASYQATLDALTAAGAKPGDRVDVVAHSQGGMIAAHLAMESAFTVTTQITAGSPSEPALGADQTLVQLRNDDDPVSRLAGGGAVEGTGSPDSFTATRDTGPDGGGLDLGLDTHSLDSYLDTAELVDASDDPRARALDEYWAELDQAEVVERVEFRAERTELP